MRAALGRRSYTLILLLSLVLHAISTPNIGIQQDWLSNVGPNDLYSYSAIIKFNQNDDGKNPVDDLSDGQLAALASQAYNEMKAIGKQNAPLTMGALATNNQIYFASSIMGKDRGNWLATHAEDISKPNTLITAAGGCRLGGSHRYGGRCSEINLADVFYEWNKNLNLQGTRSRILAWGTTDSQDPRVYYPCYEDKGRWGCYTFLRAVTNANPKDHLKDENIRFIPANTPKDDNWPDGLQFQSLKARMNIDNFDTFCHDLETYDPNHPDPQSSAPPSRG